MGGLELALDAPFTVLLAGAIHVQDEPFSAGCAVVNRLCTGCACFVALYTLSVDLVEDLHLWLASIHALLSTNV